MVPLFWSSWTKKYYRHPNITGCYQLFCLVFLLTRPHAYVIHRNQAVFCRNQAGTHLEALSLPTSFPIAGRYCGYYHSGNIIVERTRLILKASVMNSLTRHASGCNSAINITGQSTRSCLDFRPHLQNENCITVLQTVDPQGRTYCCCSVKWTSYQTNS